MIGYRLLRAYPTTCKVLIASKATVYNDLSNFEKPIARGEMCRNKRNVSLGMAQIVWRRDEELWNLAKTKKQRKPLLIINSARPY
jgi:hypothetical protein